MPTKETVNDISAWAGRVLIGLVTWLCSDIRGDVKMMKEEFPKMQEQIRLLQSDNERMKNKFYSQLRFPAKPEDEITIFKLLKKPQ